MASTLQLFLGPLFDRLPVEDGTADEKGNELEAEEDLHGGEIS